MTIDIDGVGADMLSIPIRADCQVPNVEILLADNKLDFSEAFLSHPEIRSFKLVNKSDLKAKFQVLPQS